MKSFLTKNLHLILILFVATCLRFYQLGQNPPSLFVDEVSNGYNAYSILKTARDEYGNFLPLTFRAFGDYNPALSVYTLIPSIALFGLSEFAVRFPSALLGTLTVLLTYFLSLKISQNKKLALGAAFLLAISPWHLQFSRYDHEANFMIFFTILGLTLFLHSFKKYRVLLVSLTFFGLALNTYQGAKIWMPIFLLCIFYWYRKEILKAGIIKLFLASTILLIFALPIMLNFQKSLIRGKSVGIFNEQKPLKTFISGYLSHFAPNFLFVAGDNIGRHSVFTMGQLYFFELPIILIGLISLIKKRTRNTNFLLTWFLLAPIPAALSTPTPHALRSITFLPLWSIIAAFGLKSIASSKLGKKPKLALILALIIVGLFNFLTYLHLYYKHEPNLKSPEWSDGYRRMVTYIDKIKEDYDTIAISNYYGHPYIFVLFYSKYDPKLYHQQLPNKYKFDKYQFFAANWEKKTTGKVLMVRPKWQIPNPAPKYLKFIYAKNDDLVFRISEE